MCSAPASPSSDRRHEVGLRFDPGSGRMEIGTFSVTLAPNRANREVLNAYVELAARSRGDRVANVLDVRQADVEALAAALDLDAAGLAAEIQAVLGATRAAAISMVSRLRESRVIGGLTKAATGAVLAGSLVAGGTVVAGGSESGTLARHAAAAAPTRSPDPGTAQGASAPAGSPVTPDAAWDPVIDGPVTEDANGVGLIPPIEQDANGVVLIPAADQDEDTAGGS